MKQIFKNIEENADAFGKHLEANQDKFEGGLIVFMASQEADGVSCSVSGMPNVIIPLMVQVCQEDKMVKEMVCQAALNMMDIEMLQKVIKQKEKENEKRSVMADKNVN